jgi:hypothetical protein
LNHFSRHIQRPNARRSATTCGGGAWRDDVDAHDFAFEREQIVWTMAAIHAAGDDIDRVRVAAEPGEKKLKHVGVGYIADLGDGCNPRMKIEPYIAKLHDATARRNIMHHTHMVMGHLHSDDRTVDELIEMGAAALAGMRQAEEQRDNDTDGG